jgi:glutathione synthase/RimK-type ligase-like ATP-grasp enzyme
MAAHSRSSRPRVALATCAELPRGDADESWAATVPALLNPFDVLVWNTDKRYLAELAGEGIAAIETRFVEPGSEPSLPAEGEIVVKPSVSAGSRDTARFALDEGFERDRAERLIAEIHAGGRTAMLQPYLSAVDELGETALVYLDGALSHTVRKGPLLRPGVGPTKGFFAPETIAPRDPSEAERALGERVSETIERRFGALLYARVDLVPGDDGAPVVLEVELTEPSLFFGHAADAAQRFAAALVARIRW